MYCASIDKYWCHDSSKNTVSPWVQSAAHHRGGLAATTDFHTNSVSDLFSRQNNEALDHFRFLGNRQPTPPLS